MDVIISVRPEYVQRIIAGKKSIEIRTKRPNLGAGDTIWIYEKLPTGHISVRTQVDCLKTMTPLSAWRKHKTKIGISCEEYKDYVNGRELISLIFLRAVRVLHRPVSLEQLRYAHSEFCPPQFMRKVREPKLIQSLGAAL